MRPLELGIRRLLPAVAQRIHRPGKPADFDPSAVRRILIVRQHNQLGDMLCVVPLLRALRAQIPHAEIDLLASPVNAEIMQHHRLLADVLVYDKKDYLSRWGLRLGRLLRLRKLLRARSYDLVAVPSTVSVSLTSDILAAMTGAPYQFGPRSIDGVANPGAFLYNRPVDLDWREHPTRHQTLRNADLLASELELPDDLSHEITLTHEEIRMGRDDARRLRLGRNRLMVIHPGAGKPPNRWPVAQFAQTALRLQNEYQSSVVATIGPMDEEAHRDLQSILGETIQYVVNWDLRRLASLLFHVDLVISNDTGIMHVAASVGAPLVSIFGPTNPLQWAPMGPRSRYIQCDPINSISVDEVMGLVDRTVRNDTSEPLGRLVDGHRSDREQA